VTVYEFGILHSLPKSRRFYVFNLIKVVGVICLHSWWISYVVSKTTLSLPQTVHHLSRRYRYSTGRQCS